MSSVSAAFDLVIRNGLVADGTGQGLREADIAIVGAHIVEVGRVLGGGREEIDASSLMVTPGFVDIHTHYDGQVTWDSRVTPSSLHGVTTVILGNCGVGFAPCRPSERELLIKMMEGVEDIPEVVLTAGVPWNWETFPEYLDALDARQYDIDVGTQMPHSPVRVYAMGKRGGDREPATPDDLRSMIRIVQEGIRAGALGFSTSRTMNHRYKDGRLAPSITAGEDELIAIARGLNEVGQGVIQGVDDWTDIDNAFGMWERVASASGRPISLTMSERGQNDATWAPRMEKLRAANADGLTFRGQALCRPIGVILGFDLSFNPFTYCPSFAEIEALPITERTETLRRAEVRERLLDEKCNDRNPQFLRVIRSFETIFPLSDPPNYWPKREESIAALAGRLGRSPLEVAYDCMLADDGGAMLYAPVTNFGNFTMDNVLSMLEHPNMIFGLGDGGAHCGMVCDASATTYMLTYWTRDHIGRKLSIERAVQKLTSETAGAIGLNDRGIVAPGYKADLNVIDYDRLHLHGPRMVRDLPGEGRRLMQFADGYVATVVSGKITYRHGKQTEALPGRLVRGARHAQPRA